MNLFEKVIVPAGSPEVRFARNSQCLGYTYYLRNNRLQFFSLKGISEISVPISRQTKNYNEVFMDFLCSVVAFTENKTKFHSIENFLMPLFPIYATKSIVFSDMRFPSILCEQANVRNVGVHMLAGFPEGIMMTYQYNQSPFVVCVDKENPQRYGIVLLNDAELVLGRYATNMEIYEKQMREMPIQTTFSDVTKKIKNSQKSKTVKWDATFVSESSAACSCGNPNKHVPNGIHCWASL